MSERLRALSDDLGAGGAWTVVATLGLLVLLNAAVLGSEPWPFEPGEITPSGPLGWVVDAVGSDWNTEALRAAAVAAGLLLCAAAAAAWLLRRWSARGLLALAGVVVALLLLPAVVLQVALRDSTEPWFFVNDSTYQIEIAGELLREGENPYGHDYRDTGLSRFYSLDGSVSFTYSTRTVEQPAFRHFLYLPGPALSASLWTLLPAPWEDYRLLVALATLGGLGAALLFRGPPAVRLAAGAAIAANPIAVRAAWFGTADATSIVFLLLAFAFLTRARYATSGAMLALAVIFKQFALIALPFLALAIYLHAARPDRIRAAVAFGVVLLAGILPFLAWDPGAFRADVLPAGDTTYPIVGPGLSSLLVELGVVDGQYGAYPFLPLVLVLWLPFTALLLWAQLRTGTLWAAAAGFAASIFVFIFLLRILQPSFFIWPLTAILVAVLLAAWEREPRARPAAVP